MAKQEGAEVSRDVSKTGDVPPLAAVTLDAVSGEYLRLLALEFLS